jgi:hypothetical protein
MPFLTDPSQERVAWRTSVTALTETFEALKGCDIAVEHIYDY